MLRTTLRLTACAAAVCVCLAAGTAHAQAVPIVSAKTGGVSLTANQLADIFLGRSSSFPDGRPAIPCDYVESSPLRDEFYARFIGKSPAQVKSYWAKIVFTGRGQPPKEVRDSEHAKKLVTENTSLICYIDRRHVDANVTVVRPQ